MRWRDDKNFCERLHSLATDYAQATAAARKRLLPTEAALNSETTTTIVETAEAIFSNLIKSAKEGDTVYGFGPHPEWIRDSHGWIENERDTLNGLRKQCGMPAIESPDSRAVAPVKHIPPSVRVIRKASPARLDNLQNEVNYQMHLTRSKSSYEQERYRDALIALEEAAKLKGNTIHVLACRGHTMQHLPTRVKEGMQILEQACAMDAVTPDDMIGKILAQMLPGSPRTLQEASARVR